MLESGALGVPVVAMDTGGTSDIIVHEETGLLSPTPAQFARDLARLASDAALRARLAAGAKAHVESRFASRSVVDRIAALYESIIEAHVGRRG